MKTVKELAEKYSTSKQTIMYYVNKFDGKKPTKDNNGKLLINKELEKYIEINMSTKNRQKTDKESTNKNDGSFYLIEQLKEKDKQIEHLQKLLENQQILTLQANQKIELLENTQEQKKSFFSRWFK